MAQDKPGMAASGGALFGRALVRFLILAIMVRLVRDTGVRMMYPYLPTYARGLGITLTTMGALLAGRTLLMTLAPYFGHLADHSGPRRWLMLGYAVLAGGMALFGFAQGLAIAAAGIVLLGLSDAIITPLMQAYVSEQAPAAMRGRALAVVEYSWAISGIVMVSLIGWLIEFAGWQVPFRVLSLAALLAVAAFAFVLPGRPPTCDAAAAHVAGGPGRHRP